MSKIEWTEATWNPIVGCSVVSPGCTNCYAMKMAGRLEAMGTLQHYAGTTKRSKAGAVWTGKLALAPERTLLEPLRRRKPTTYFVNSMGDLFHEDVPDAWIDRVFAVMALSPQHTYQILTKRAARMRAYVSDPATPGRVYDIVCDLSLEQAANVILLARPEHAAHAPLGRKVLLGRWPLPNVWKGVSAEDQARADERVPDLLATPAAVRFVSAEPLLGPIDFGRIPSPVVTPEDEGYYHSALDGGDIHYRDSDPDYDGKVWTDVADGPLMEKLDWAIVGGESGPGARPMHPDWARSIRDQCAAAGTAFFFKQWGEWLFETNIENGQHPGDRFFNSDGKPIDEKPPFGPATGRLWHWWEPHHYASIRIGKARAGRLLYGVEHNAMPEVRHA